MVVLPEHLRCPNSARQGLFGTRNMITVPVDRGVVPSDGKALELVELGEGLVDDVAELAEVDNVGFIPAGDDRHDAAFAQLTAMGVAVVVLVAPQGVGALVGVRPRQRPEERCQAGWGSAGVVDVGSDGDHVEGNAVAVADQGVLPVLRRSTGDGPVGLALFSRARGRRRRMRASSRSARPRATRPGVCDAGPQTPQPPASGQAFASGSTRIRSPASATTTVR